MKKNFIYYIIFAFSFYLFPSCKKYIEVPPPENQLIKDLVFTDDNTAEAAISGLYASLNSYNSSFANYLANFMPAMSADEFHYAFSSASFNEFYENNLTSGNTYVSRFWGPPYSYIYHANAVLEGLEASTNLSEDVKSQINGEAFFLRAFFYFYLVNYFGDVPLILNTDYQVNTNLPRTSKAEIYANIVNDLTQAIELLSDEYPGSERIRANKVVASSLLARVYLYQGEWEKAASESSIVIQDNRFSLLDDLNGVFLKNSNEAIWQLQSINKSTRGVNTWEGFSIVPATPTGRAYYDVDETLLDAFEANDKRKTDWLKSYTIPAGTFYFPFKYKIRTSDVVEEYSMVLRLAEQYLIRAEARAQTDDLEGAVEDINIIRSRAGLDPLEQTLTKNEVLLAIEQERRIELFAEWGHRWFDLIRTGRALEVLSPIKPDLTSDDLLLPIPLDAMRTNPNLEQNPGYN